MDKNKKIEFMERKEGHLLKNIMLVQNNKDLALISRYDINI